MPRARKAGPGRRERDTSRGCRWTCIRNYGERQHRLIRIASVVGYPTNAGVEQSYQFPSGVPAFLKDLSSANLFSPKVVCKIGPATIRRHLAIYFCLPYTEAFVKRREETNHFPLANH